MRTRTNTLIASVVGLMLLAGCGDNTGWVIKPVPVNEELKEAVVASDGAFVGDKVAIIDVDGLIMNQRTSGMFTSGENPVSLFIEKLDKARQDSAIKAVVVRINSPGGGVTASDIMYNALLRFKADRKVPVIVAIEDVGASGGYYIACAGDVITAHPTSLTGSIGVLVQTVSFSGTMKMLGIEAQAVTSGPMKDMASPLKPLDKADLAVLQGVVNTYYQRFLDVVAKGRPKLTREQIKTLADGRIYTAKEAKENGLVDEIGYVDDAVKLAKTKAGISKAKVVMYDRPWGAKNNFYAAAGVAGQPQINLVNVNVPDLTSMTRPEFQYLWNGRQ